jgi:hypothetical protein
MKRYFGAAKKLDYAHKQVEISSRKKQEKFPRRL